MTTTLKDILAQLESLGNAKVRAHNKKHGAGENQFGVRLGDIRKLASQIKADEQLVMALWDTENIDARLLAILLIKPKLLSRADIERMMRSVDYAHVADWLIAYVVKRHPEKESLRQAWMDDKNPWVARAGWSLTAERIAKDPDGLDVSALLDRIESEMGDAASEAQWTMNACLAAIGIYFPQHRQRAIAIGERLGLYRDYPVSKGCVSPYAPIWINEMARRQGEKA